MRYRTTDDRRILEARDAHVVKVTVTPSLELHLSTGLELHYQGPVEHILGASSHPDARRLDFLTFPPKALNLLIGARPLSWVVFHTGDQRIVFSNSWMLTLRPHPNDSWRLNFPNIAPWTHP
ncbi:hypothetical protein GCM10027589_05520 [Actinocorallia lasiicapitis]